MNSLSIIPNLSILDVHIENLLETNSANVFCKDKKGCYLSVNHKFLQVSAMHSFDDILGKNDFDLIWAKQASLMKSHDQEIISTGYSKYYLELAKSSQQQVIQYLNYKTPLKTRNGKIIGMFGLSFALNTIDSLTNALNETRILMNKQLNNKKMNSPSLLLSEQQKNCLYYLVKGMTYKQIANTLQLSPKTVEHYVNHVKTKLNCKSRTELITKALQMQEIKNIL